MFQQLIVEDENDIALIVVGEIGPPTAGIGGGGSGGGHVIYDDGVARPQREGLNFAQGIDAVDNALLNRTDVSVTATGIGAVPTSALGVTVATLVGGVVPTSQLPAFTINQVFPVADQAARLALVGVNVGDVAIQADTGETYILTAQPPSVNGNWTLISVPGGAVSSVNGQIGVVVLDAADVGAVDLSAVGAPNGVAGLDAFGDVPDGQIANNIARIAQVVQRTDYDANTILKADSNDTPITLTVGTNTLVGRTSGSISALDPASVRAMLDLEAGVDLQPFSPLLAAFAAQTPTTDSISYWTSPGSITTTSFTSFGRNWIGLADASAGQNALGLLPGTTVQAWSSYLDGLVALAGTVDSNNDTVIPYIADDTWAQAAVSSDMVTLLGATSFVDARTLLDAAATLHTHTVSEISDLHILTDSTDLAWTDPGPNTTVGEVQGIWSRPIANSSPSVGDAYLWDGAQWAPGAVSTGGSIGADLTAIEALTGTGGAFRTAADTWALRSIAVSSGGGISVSNGDGVAGNPTLLLDADLEAVAALSSTGIGVRTGTSTWAQRSIAVSGTGIGVTNGDGVSGNPTLALDADLDALGALSSTGIAVRSASNTWVQRSIAGTSPVSITNGDGVAGNPTVAVNATLTAFGSYNTNGLLTQTAANTFTGRTIAGTSPISVTNGDGVSGNPTVAANATLTAFGAFNTNGLLTQTAANTFTGRTATGTVDQISVANGDGVSGNPTFKLGGLTGDIILDAPTFGANGDNFNGGKVDGGGFHVNHTMSINTTVTDDFLGTAFTYDFNPTITATNVQLAKSQFGPMAGYNFIGTSTYNANSGFDILSPIGFADLSLVTNQAGTARNITPGWSFVSAKAFIARGASGSISVQGNDTTLGYGGIGATSVYATMAGGTLTADELTEYTTNSFILGDVTLDRLIGYQVLHRQQMADPAYRGTIAAVLQGQPGYANAPISLTGGVTTSGSPNITVSGGLTPAMDGCIITGTNIPVLTKLNYVSATSATLEKTTDGSAQNASGSGTGLTFQIGFSTNLPTISEEIGIYVNRPLTGATALAMDAEGSVRLWNDTHTHTALPSPVIHISGDHTLNVGTGLNSFLGMQIDTNITLQDTANPFGAAGGVRHAPTITNPTSFTGTLVGANAAFTNGAVWNIATNAGNVTLTDMRGYNNQPFFQRASGANTVNVTNAYGYYHKPTYATGSHVTNSYGMYVATPGGAGTIDLNVGILVEASTRGTANVSAIFGDAIVAPSIVGGLTDNADVTIAAGATGVKGEILLDNPKIELWVSNYTHTVTGNLSSLFADNVFTMDTTGGSGGTGNGWYGVNLNGTVQFTQEANALAGAIAFQDATIYKNTTGSGNIALHDIYSFAAVPTVNANAASPTYNYYGFVSNPQFTRTTSGTGTGTTLRNFAALASVGSNTQFTTVSQFYADLTVNGGVVTTRTALAINDATGAGTLTNQYGIDIAAMTKGGTKNVGIRNANSLVNTGTIYGSESASGNVVIQSTSNATKGQISLDNPYIEMGVTDYTSTDAIYAQIFTDNSVTMNNSNGGGATGNQYRGYSHIPTVNYQLAGNIIAGAEAFYDGATYQNATGANVDPGPIRSIWITPTINFNNTSTNFASYTGVRVSPSVSRTTTGATLATLIQFEAAAPTINTGTTVTTRTALSVADASGAGTLTNNVGVDIAKMTKGGTSNVEFRNAGKTVFTNTQQTISAAGNTIVNTATYVDVNNVQAGGIVLTSNPNISTTGAQTGQVLIIVNNDSADTLTLTDGNGIQCPGNANLALGPKDTATFLYNGTEWLCIATTNQ